MGKKSKISPKCPIKKKEDLSGKKNTKKKQKKTPTGGNLRIIGGGLRYKRNFKRNRVGTFFETHKEGQQKKGGGGEKKRKVKAGESGLLV